MRVCVLAAAGCFAFFHLRFNDLVRPAKAHFLIILAALTFAGSLTGRDAALAQAEQHQVVLTQEGQVLGAVQAGIASFKGMSYAAPAVGPLRWRAPRPAEFSSDILVADKYGPACPQSSIQESAGQGDSAEDCLYINVFKPVETDGKLPVMVWIHGGSFISGAGGDPLYDGSKLASEGVIVVTFNYRLGPLGWLPTHGLFQDVGNDAVANFGMLDQIAALRWVHDNIGAFSGDVDNVTLFGQDAGGMSVTMLMASPEAAGLFQKAIVESGFGREPARSLGDTESVREEFVKALGMGGTRSQLRTIAPELIVSAETLLAGEPTMRYSHVIDGRTLKEVVADAFRAGRESGIPLIIGTNGDEAGSGSHPEESLKLLPETVEGLRKYYPDAAGHPAALAAKILTDQVFTEPARFLARTHASHGFPAYRYLFSYVPEQKRSPVTGAGHGDELQFIFGTLGARGGLFSYRDRDTSNILRSYWTNFAKTGNPNGAGLPLWEAYPQDDKILMISNAGIASLVDPWTERLDRLERQAETAKERCGGVPALPCGSNESHR